VVIMLLERQPLAQSRQQHGVVLVGIGRMRPVHSSQFEAVRHAVMASGQPYRGADLDGMATDIHYYMGNSALFDRIMVKKTGDRRCLLVVRCRPAGRGISPQQVAGELERIWAEDLRFDHQAAHALQVTDDTVTLQFVTQGHPGGPYVTGSLIVTWTA
jgi:hypothetical protein